MIRYAANLKKVSFVLLAATALAMGGCGLNKEDKGEEHESTQRLDKPEDGDALAAGDCSPEAAFQLVDPELRLVPSSNLHIQNPDGKIRTMCDVILDSGSLLSIFHITSIKCYTCLRWIEEFDTALRKNGYIDQVAHVAVITDSPSEVNDDDFDLLAYDVADEAIWVRDHNGELSSFFTPEDGGSVPVIIAMDDLSRGFEVDVAKLSLQDVIDLANATLETNIKPE